MRDQKEGPVAVSFSLGCPTVPLTGCVPWGKALNLSEPFVIGHMGPTVWL